jgi:serine/threonine-protein kinase HipA
MAVRSKNVHYQLASIQTRHWQTLAQRSGADGVWEAMQAMVARVEHAIDAVHAQRPAGYHPRTAQAIFEGLRRQCRTWEAGLPATA